MTLCSYTSGRFLFHEKLRLEERHVEFNVTALKQAAEASLGKKHGKVIGMSKLSEGGFNRVLTLVLEDGFELIAKIPYHIAVPKYFATASEAATLTFLRSKGILVPKVYGYCANAENPVGTEYILMEKASGVCLKSKWRSMTKQQIGKLAYDFLQMDTKLFETEFGATGSLYFKDVPIDLRVLHRSNRRLHVLVWQQSWIEAGSRALAISY